MRHPTEGQVKEMAAAAAAVGGAVIAKVMAPMAAVAVANAAAKETVLKPEAVASADLTGTSSRWG